VLSNTHNKNTEKLLEDYLKFILNPSNSRGLKVKQEKTIFDQDDVSINFS
jgi:hypothetical protein